MGPPNPERRSNPFGRATRWRVYTIATCATGSFALDTLIDNFLRHQDLVLAFALLSPVIVLFVLMTFAGSFFAKGPAFLAVAVCVPLIVGWIGFLARVIWALSQGI